MTTGRERERGQALILLTISMVILLGFTALAIDGSMIYADRRYAQNVADSASLSGGGKAALSLENSHINYITWDCQSAAIGDAAAEAIQAARASSATNNISIEGSSVEDGHGVKVECGDGDSGSFDDKYLDVIVKVTIQTETSFAHFVYPSPIRNTVEAVTRIHPRENLAHGYAIVALNPAGCQGQQNGLMFHGNAETLVWGGGAFSNGCLRAVGSTNVDVTDGDISYVVDEFGNMSLLSPRPQQVANRIPDDTFDVGEPECTHPDAHNWTDRQLDSQFRTQDRTLELEPGLYCITGNVEINANETVIGSSVTLVIVDGHLHINGRANIQLTAPSHTPNPHPAIPGVVIYVPRSNNNDIHINGNSESYYEGVILAPGSEVEFIGTGNTFGYKAQVIGWDVRVGGNADLGVVFDPNRMPQRSTHLDLYR